MTTGVFRHLHFTILCMQINWALSHSGCECQRKQKMQLYIYQLNFQQTEPHTQIEEKVTLLHLALGCISYILKELF